MVLDGHLHSLVERYRLLAVSVQRQHKHWHYDEGQEFAQEGLAFKNICRTYQLIEYRYNKERQQSRYE